MAEPDENTVCVFCNMKVYPKEHELGKFTAKSATENGDVLFLMTSDVYLTMSAITGKLQRNMYAITTH